MASYGERGWYKAVTAIPANFGLFVGILSKSWSSHLFSHTFRFIDDLLTINDNNLFLQNFKDIYPPELQLHLETSGDHVTFLDLDLTLVDGHLDVKLFDKRHSFPFAIVRLQFLSSNIPTTMFYYFIGADILRIGRVSSSFENFLLSASI